MPINELQFAGLLLHLIGLIIFGGGQFWIKAFMLRIKQSKYSFVRIHFIQTFPKIFKLTIWGLLLLFGGGIIGLFAINDPNLIGLPGAWGSIMLIKILIYVIIVIDSILINEIFLPEVIDVTPKTAEDEQLEILPRAITPINRILNINLLLTFVLVILGAIEQIVPK